MAKPAKKYDMSVRALTAEVASESTAGASYEVSYARCDCPDFTYRHKRGEFPFCKHIIAAYAADCPELGPALTLIANLLKLK
jgi:hypothetical protein